MMEQNIMRSPSPDMVNRDAAYTIMCRDTMTRSPRDRETRNQRKALGEAGRPIP